MKIFGSKVGFTQLAILGNVGKENNHTQISGDEGKMKDEDLFVQSWLYVHMIYELPR